MPMLHLVVKLGKINTARWLVEEAKADVNALDSVRVGSHLVALV